MSPVKNTHYRVSQNKKYLSQNDQMRLFMAVVSKLDGIVFKTVDDFAQAVNDFTTYRNFDRVTMAVFNKEFKGQYKGDIRTHHPELESRKVFSEFVTCLRFGKQFDWNEEDFKDILDYIGAKELQLSLENGAKSEKIPYQLSSEKIDHLVGRKFWAYLPSQIHASLKDIKPEAITSISKGRIEFRSLVDVEFALLSPANKKSLLYEGRYKFINDENYLFVEFDLDHRGDSSYQFLFDVRGVNVIDQLAGHFMNLKESAIRFSCIVEEVNGKGFKPRIYHQEELYSLPEHVKKHFGLEKAVKADRKVPPLFTDTLTMTQILQYSVQQMRELVKKADEERRREERNPS